MSKHRLLHFWSFKKTWWVKKLLQDCYEGQPHKDVCRSGMTIKSWATKVVYYPNHGFGKFSAGWSKFARECNLKKGQVCFFELIDDQNLVLKVSISTHTHTPLINLDSSCLKPGYFTGWSDLSNHCLKIWIIKLVGLKNWWIICFSC